MLEVTKDTFEPEVLQAEGYVFVDFFGASAVATAFFSATQSSFI